MLALFHVVFLYHTTRKTYNFALIIPRTHPIIPEYSLILFTTYYSQNYSGIIDASLVTTYSELGGTLQGEFGLLACRVTAMESNKNSKYIVTALT